MYMISWVVLVVVGREQGVIRLAPNSTLRSLTLPSPPFAHAQGVASPLPTTPPGLSVLWVLLVLWSAMMTIDSTKTSRRPRRGHALPEAERRRHAVMMRVNDAELAEIDTRRGDYDRGEFLRMSLFGQKAARPRPTTVIPELNQTAWLELSRSASNLNQFARHLNETGIQSGDLPQIIVMLTEFRAALIGARLAEDQDDES